MQVLGPTKSSFIACIRLKNAKFMGLVSDLKLSSASGILDNIERLVSGKEYSQWHSKPTKNQKLECQDTII